MENNPVHSDQTEKKIARDIFDNYPESNNDVGKATYILQALHHISVNGSIKDADGKFVRLKPPFKEVDFYSISEPELCRVIIESVRNITKEDFNRIFPQIKFALNVTFIYDGNRTEYSF